MDDQAHCLEVPLGVGLRIADHVKEHHGPGALTHPESDRVTLLGLGSRCRLLLEDRVLGKLVVGLVVHLDEERDPAQNRPGLVHRHSDQGRDLDPVRNERGGCRVLVATERVEEFDDEVAEGDDKGPQPDEEEQCAAPAVVPSVSGTPAVVDRRRPAWCCRTCAGAGGARRPKVVGPLPVAAQVAAEVLGGRIAVDRVLGEQLEGDRLEGLGHCCPGCP